MGALAAIKASDIPVSTLITAVAGLTGIAITYFTTTQRGRQDRFGSWQVTKREVYADFLAAAHEYRNATSDSEKKSKFVKELERARLYVYEDARTYLDQVAADHGKLTSDNDWKALQEKLRADVLIVGDAT